MSRRRGEKDGRRNVLGLVFFFLFVPYLVILAGNIRRDLTSSRFEGTAGTVDQIPLEPAPPLADPAADPGTEDLTIRKGSTTYDLLVEAGLTPQEVIELTEAFSSVTDLSRCRPGEVLTIARRTDGTIGRVSYRRGPLTGYEAERVVSGWVVREKDFPYTLRVETVTGKIESSLFQSLDAMGEKDSLTISLLDILAWEIDFAHESRKGDRFGIIVEKYYLDGELVEYGPILAASYTTSRREIRAYSLGNERGGMDYFEESGRSVEKSFLKSPLRYTRISSSYSRRRLHPVTGRVQPHYAIDYAAPAGTPVWSVADGTVRSASDDRNNGRMIRIDHPGGYETFYLHLTRFAKGMKKGKKVRQKQTIGYVGSTGIATGPHLDYRLKKRGSYVNPQREDFPRAEPVPEERREELRERVAWLESLWESEESPRVAGGF